jgi:ribosomal protein S16
MLTMRLHPTGRKHKKLYRLVVAQKHRHVSKLYVNNLGYYNPYTKEDGFDVEKIKSYISQNIEMSEAVVRILKHKKILA